MKLLWLALLLSVPGYASDWRLLELDSMSVDYFKYYHIRDPALFPHDDDLTFGAALRPNMRLLTYQDLLALTWNNEVHMSSTPSWVRHVGWHWDLGVDVGCKLRVFYEHHSQHLLDSEPEFSYSEGYEQRRKFPVFDKLGIRLHLHGGC